MILSSFGLKLLFCYIFLYQLKDQLKLHHSAEILIFSDTSFLGFKQISRVFRKQARPDTPPPLGPTTFSINIILAEFLKQIHNVYLKNVESLACK